jgi:hypothetical protein
MKQKLKIIVAVMAGSLLGFSGYQAASVYFECRPSKSFYHRESLFKGLKPGQMRAFGFSEDLEMLGYEGFRFRGVVPPTKQLVHYTYGCDRAVDDPGLSPAGSTKYISGGGTSKNISNFEVVIYLEPSAGENDRYVIHSTLLAELGGDWMRQRRSDSVELEIPEGSRLYRAVTQYGNEQSIRLDKPVHLVELVFGTARHDGSLDTSKPHHALKYRIQFEQVQKQ